MNADRRQAGGGRPPAPVKELAARRTGTRSIVGGGHNGLTAAAYLAKAGQSRARPRTTRAARRRLHARAPVPRRALQRQPVRVRRRPARRGRHQRAAAPPARLRVLRRRPQPVGPVRGRHDRSASGSTTPRPRRTSKQLKVSKQDIDGYWAYEHLFDEIRQRLRTRGRDTWLGETPDPRGDRGPAARRADDDRHRLQRVDRRRPRRPHARPAPQGRALRPGRDRRLRRPEGPRHGLDQAHALPGRPRGPGPRVGLRQGRHGDDQLRDRRRRAGGRRHARHRRPRRRDHPRRGRHARGRDAHPRPHRSSATPTRSARWTCSPTSPTTTARASRPGRSAARS